LCARAVPEAGCRGNRKQHPRYARPKRKRNPDLKKQVAGGLTLRVDPGKRGPPITFTDHKKRIRKRNRESESQTVARRDRDVASSGYFNLAAIDSDSFSGEFFFSVSARDARRRKEKVR
jgi:hypothetical protein